MYKRQTKLNVKVLPCIIFFRNGVAYDRIVGFEELGAKDDFPTSRLENMLLTAGIIAYQRRGRTTARTRRRCLRGNAPRGSRTGSQSTTPGTRTATSIDE